MPGRSLERFTDRATEENLERHATTPNAESDLPDLESTQDGGLAFVGKVKKGIDSAEAKTKAKTENKPRKIERSSIDAEDATVIELESEDIKDATEEETKAILLREAQIAANRLIPNLYIGEQRRIRERAINEQIETLELALVRARFDEDKTKMDEIEERVTPLKDESRRLTRYKTAEEEVAARIQVMEASRIKLKAQKKRVSPVEAALEDLREVQTKLTEANTWEDPKEASNRKRTRAFEELRLKKFKENAVKELGQKKTIDTKGPLREKKRLPNWTESYTARKEHLLKTLQKNIDDLAWAFDEKYGTSIEHVMVGEETLIDKAKSWWRDTRVGKFFSKKTEQYGGRDMDKETMIEQYVRLKNRYQQELKDASVPGEKTQERAPTERGEVLERRALLRRNVNTLGKATAEAISSSIGEVAARPILAIAEPILRKRRWEREWAKMQGEHDAELFNEIAESIMDDHNEDALMYVAEATGISPWNLTVADIGEFFYTTAEGDELRKQLMSKLRKEMEQRERS